MLDQAGYKPGKHGAAVNAIRALIAEGAYQPGDRLPPERELIGALSMSRGAIRRALDALEQEGLVWRHVGKGTFVKAPAGSAGSPQSHLLSRQVTPVKMMRARLSMEPALAREAAVNASSDMVANLHRIKAAAVAAGTWAQYEEQDDLFHREIAKACDNVLLLSLFDHLNEVRRAVAWQTVVRKTERPAADHTSFAEHDEIATAIEARDPDGAQTAMRRHLSSVAARLFGDVT